VAEAAVKGRIDPMNWPTPIPTDTRMGTAVKVRRDNGDVIDTTTRSRPWRLGKTSWVVCVVGISGTYKLNRVALLDDGR
jgi:hypothetical protein